MPTITRTQVRQEMLKRAPILGRALTADSITKAGPSLTDVSEWERQRAGLTSFEGQYIHRYNLADNDRFRLITALNSGASDGIINVDGPAYADNGDMAYERLTVHPDDLNFAIAEGQRRQRIRTNIALVRGGLDLDMETAGVASWTPTNCTRFKDIAVAFSGTQSLSVVGTGANPTISSVTMGVSPSRLIYIAAIVLPFTGPVTLTLWDSLNNLAIGSVTLTSGLGSWIVMTLQAIVPSNTDQIQFRFSSTAANAQFWIDTCFGPYQAGQTEYPIQPQLDQAYKLRFVRPAKFISPTTTPGIYDADSMEFVGDLTRPEDWDLEAFRRDLNFTRLRFQANSYNNRNLGWAAPFDLSPSTFMQNQMRPIWLAMEAKASDFEPLLTETSLTNQPLDECVCYSLRYLAETMLERDPGNPVWQNMLQEYKMWAVVEDMAHPPQAMYRPQRLHNIRA